MAQKPDDVTAKDSGGGFDPHPEGQFAVLCVDVVDLGQKVEEFQGKNKVMPKLALVFVSGERQKDDAKSLALITSEMTNSAGEKANLRKFIESWRGKSYTPEQVAEGLPITKLWGQPALISVEHVTTRKGRKFAKIRAVSPLPKGLPAPEARLLDEYTRPKFLEDKKGQYAEAVAKFLATEHDGDPGPALPDDDGDDPLPF